MTVDQQLPPDDPFSALSLQLVSHGFLTRPLLLSSLLPSLPSLPSGSSSSSLKKHQDLLLLRARSLDQITKLLWNLLETNQGSKEAVREAVERESRVFMEFEREKTLRDRVEKEKEALARELEKEKAKSKDLESKLKAEQDRHKHSREELLKSRNALQFVKTQSLHDQKKREQEVNQLHSRLSKLGSTSSASDTGTRIQILNSTSSSSSHSSSSPSGSPLYSSTFNRGTASSASSRRNLSTPPPASATTELLNSEIELLKSSLQELDQTRLELGRENLEIREFLGDLGDWIERLLEEERLTLIDLKGEPRDEADSLEEEEEDSERKEAKFLLERLKSQEQTQLDQGFILSPTPHLSSPTSLILPQLSTKLHILRLNLLSSLRSTTSLVSAERERGLEALELEIEAREQAIEEKEIREREVEEMKRVLVESQVLLQEFTEARGGGGKPRASRAIGRDDSGDELPENIVRDLEQKKKEKRTKTTSKLTSAETEKPSTSRPSVPSQSVQDFLGSLGLDTPVASTSAGGEKEALRSTQLLKETNSTASNREKDLVRKKKKESLETVSSKSSSSSKSNGKEKEEEVSKKPSSTKSMTRPSVPVTSSRTSATAPLLPSTTKTEETTSAALSSILSLALSPPPTADPLISSQLSTQHPPQTKGVLGSSRAANGGGGPLPKPSKVGTKSREELIKEKKASLLAAQRGPGGAALNGGKK